MEVQKPGRQTILVVLIIFVSPFAVYFKDLNYDMLALLYIMALSGTAIRAAPNAWFYTELNCTTPEGRDSNPNWDDYSKRLTTGRNKCWKKEWDWNTKDGARRRAVWIDKKGKKDKGCLWLYEDSECINKPDVMEFDPNNDWSTCWNFDLSTEEARFVGYASYWFTEDACPLSGSEYRNLLPRPEVLLMSV